MTPGWFCPEVRVVTMLLEEGASFGKKTSHGGIVSRECQVAPSIYCTVAAYNST